HGKGPSPRVESPSATKRANARGKDDRDGERDGPLPPVLWAEVRSDGDNDKDGGDVYERDVQPVFEAAQEKSAKLMVVRRLNDLVSRRTEDADKKQRSHERQDRRCQARQGMSPARVMRVGTGDGKWHPGVLWRHRVGCSSLSRGRGERIGAIARA